MPVYARKVDSSNSIFRNRQTVIMGGGYTNAIPIPDTITLCNSCNKNVSEGYLIYLSKNELKKNQPYDYYCNDCMKRSFPKAVIVEE